MKFGYKSVIILLLFFSSIVGLQAQERTVSGTVTDATGPLPTVSILIKGTSTGTETNFDGKYSIKAKQGSILVFSFLGMKTVERTVGSSNTINVLMSEDANVLDEVVVVAYGTSSKEALTGAVTTIKPGDIEKQICIEYFYCIGRSFSWGNGYRS
jgi:hypothetical protein